MEINTGEFKSTFRHDNCINKMIKEYMIKMDCNRSNAIRALLQFVLELGGVALIKD